MRGATNKIQEENSTGQNLTPSTNKLEEEDL